MDMTKICTNCYDQCFLEGIYVYIPLSPGAERPLSRLLAHSGAWYEISDLREIYGAGRRNSPGSSGGCSTCGRAQFAPIRHVCAEPLCLDVLRKPGVFPFRGLGPSRTERVREVASVAGSGPGAVP